MTTQRTRNIEQHHRSNVREICEALLRTLAPHEIESWLGLSYPELLDYTSKTLQQERVDVTEASQ